MYLCPGREARVGGGSAPAEDEIRVAGGSAPDESRVGGGSAPDESRVGGGSAPPPPLIAPLAGSLRTRFRGDPPGRAEPQQFRRYWRQRSRLDRVSQPSRRYAPCGHERSGGSPREG